MILNFIKQIKQDLVSPSSRVLQQFWSSSFPRCASPHARFARHFSGFIAWGCKHVYHFCLEGDLTEVWQRSSSLVDLTTTCIVTVNGVREWWWYVLNVWSFWQHPAQVAVLANCLWANGEWGWRIQTTVESVILIISFLHWSTLGFSSHHKAIHVLDDDALFPVDIPSWPQLNTCRNLKRQMPMLRGCCCYNARLTIWW